MPALIDSKLYISGPMTGMPEFNYPLFQEVKTNLTAQGFNVVSPHDVDDIYRNGIPYRGDDELEVWEYYMRYALILQLECNAWVGLPGWPKSRGAMREFNLAVDLGYGLYTTQQSLTSGKWVLTSLMP